MPLSTHPGRPSWLRVAAVMFGVGWGANQFASLILAYHQHRGISVGTDDALFGIYAVGLVPALLLGGPASDRWGRSRVVTPAALVSVAATVVLMTASGSVPLLFVGRFLGGAVSGAVFAAGTAWVKELSVPPFDPTAGEQSGARRAAIALSMGFGLGPLVAGAVAQWGPAALTLPYLPHLVIMALVIPGIRRVPETVTPVGRVDRPDRVTPRPGVLSTRLLAVVVPVAPWVFASASVSFAVLPTVVSSRTQGFGIAFAGLMAGITLGVGVLVQPLARRLDRNDDARGAAVGLASVVGGLLVASWAAHLVSPPLVLVAAVLLGAGYGFCLVAGLLEIQRLAGPDDLAGLTSVYFALTYVGFAVPVVLAELTRVTGYATLLAGLAGLAVICLVLVARQAARSVSAPGAPTPADPVPRHRSSSPSHDREAPGSPAEGSTTGP